MNGVSHRARPGRAFVLALALAGGMSEADAASFAGGGAGPIPDNNPSGRSVTFNVSGIAHPLTTVRLEIQLTHTWAGDLRTTLTAPGGMSTLVIFSRIGVSSASSFGANADLDGVYAFDDDAGEDYWSTVLALGDDDIVPSGRYRTSTAGTRHGLAGGCSSSLTAAFAGLAPSDVNGVWTLNIADEAIADTGSVDAAMLEILDDRIFAAGTDPYLRGACRRALFDYTGSGSSSYVVVRNTGGGPSGEITWFIQDNDGTTTGAQQSFVLGNASNFFIDGDYDGDGITDAAVWDAAPPAHFTVRRSSRPNDAPMVVELGQSGDDPTHVGDYDGDGFDDFAVYRGGVSSGDPSHTLIRLSSGAPDRDLVTGENGAFPSGGVDYDGDGKADMAIQANAGGGVASFRLYDGTTGAIVGAFNWGTPTDVIVVGNHSGDALYDITTIHGSGGNIVWSTRDTGTGVGQPDVVFGTSATDFPLAGDYDGDGLDDYAVWNSTTGFSVRPSGNPGTPITVNFGQNGDYPVANNRTH